MMVLLMLLMRSRFCLKKLSCRCTAEAVELCVWLLLFCLIISVFA